MKFLPVSAGTHKFTFPGTKINPDAQCVGVLCFCQNESVENCYNLLLDLPVPSFFDASLLDDFLHVSEVYHAA